MTVANPNDARRSANGNGVTTVFAGPPAIEASHIIVRILTVATGILSEPLEYNVDYSISGLNVVDTNQARSDITVTMDEPPASGETLVIDRDPPDVQGLVYPEAGRFPALSHAEALDLMVMRLQAMRATVGRAVRVSDGEDAGFALPSPAARAGTVFGFDQATGEPVYLTAEASLTAAVRYDIPMELTTEQQERVRTTIDFQGGFDDALDAATKDMPADQAAKLPAPQPARAWGYRYSIFDFAGGETERAKETSVADFQATFADALSSGEPVWVPPWDYPIRSLGNDNAGVAGGMAGVSITAEVPIDVECGMGARFIAGDIIVDGDGIPLAVDLFQFYNGGGTLPSIDNAGDLRFAWRGGYFDARHLTAEHGIGLALGGPSFMRLYKRWSPSVRDAVFDAGYTAFTEAGIAGNWAGAGIMDQHLSSHQCINEDYQGNVFIGAFDLGIYINGYSSTSGSYADGPGGEVAKVIGNMFWHCGTGAAVKRKHRGSILAFNRLTECGAGLFQAPGGVVQGDGKRSKFIGNSFYKIVAQPIYITGGEGDFVAFNEIINFGHSLHDDGVTPRNVGVGSDIGGISVRSTIGTKVIGNTIKQEGNWATNTDTSNPVTGIVLGSDAEYSNGASLAIVTQNTIENCVRPIKEFVECDNNLIYDNPVRTTNGSSIASDLLGTTPIVDSIDIAKAFLDIVSDGDVILELQVSQACTITETVTKSVTGTATATFKINATALNGTANAVSSTKVSQAHTANNVAAVGDTILVTISGASSCTDLAISVKGTRRRAQA